MMLAGSSSVRVHFSLGNTVASTRKGQWGMHLIVCSKTPGCLVEQRTGEVTWDAEEAHFLQFNTSLGYMASVLKTTRLRENKRKGTGEMT